MRELRFKAKVAKSAPVPDWLVRFFRRVDAVIRNGDENAVCPSDDGLQDHDVYGGLIEEGGPLFNFTVFPGPGNHISDPRRRRSSARFAPPLPNCGGVLRRPPPTIGYYLHNLSHARASRDRHRSDSLIAIDRIQ